MKNKTSTFIKSGINRKKVPSDVSPTTSLPPLVEGQLRCFLRVTVSRVLWTITKPPQNSQIRIKWWGESSSGTLFRPRDGTLVAQKDIQSTARFPVRCGPKQFTSYLTDMGILVLDVITKPDRLPVARAQIKALSRLTMASSISGFYTVLSPTSEKMGELQVTLALEPLVETYDSSCSLPTPDMSIDAAPKALPNPNLQGPPSAPNPQHGKNTLASRTDKAPRGIDELANLQRRGGPVVCFGLEGEIPGEPRPSVHSPHTNDLLTALLVRGSKLREAMVMSSLKSDLDCEMALKDTAPTLPKDNTRSISLPPLLPSSERPFQQLGHHDTSPPIHTHSPQAPDIPECPPDDENRAVELLLGSMNGSLLEAWDGEGSPLHSLSVSSSLCVDSELNDPQYDESLLENLFYRAPLSDSSDHNVELEDDGKPRQGEALKNSRVISEQPVLETRGRLVELSLDRIAQLGAIRLARVSVLSLALPIEMPSSTQHKATSKGRLHRPTPSMRCTYFVEYVFPVAPSSQTPAAEVTRLVSSKVIAGAVKFLQRIVFPVQFSGSTLEQWWETDLTFKIYSRKGTEKKPILIGTAAFPLRSVLESVGLGRTTSLLVRSIRETDTQVDLGPLKVSVQLAVTNEDFAAKRKPPPVSQSRLLPKSSPPKLHSPTQPNLSPRQQSSGPSSNLQPAPAPQANGPLRQVSPDPSPNLHQSAPPHQPSGSQGHAGSCTSSRGAVVEEERVDVDVEEVLLHALLMVPDGRDLSCGPSFPPPNVYLNCKLFGTDETARSTISWGHTNPTFSFIQVAPVTLSSHLLERMKNNVMVIEVWQRAGSQSQDGLLGLVKLPLHQFYMSYRDNKIAHILLQAQYPVVAVDSQVPVVDLFSGSVRGSLRVLLAMGQAQQIVALQRLREEEMYTVSLAPRPHHFLDQVPQRDTMVCKGVAEALTEHVFVVRVEKVRGLAPLQATVWGEADCYIQYSFPIQEEQAAHEADVNIPASSVTLQAFRTATTLCVPDPVFGHTETHVLLAPPAVPVQNLLLSSLSTQGFHSGGGVQFDVWCRYYYPNVRDQQVARGLLLLSKLCGLVTLQRQQPSPAQLFSLPLIPRTEPSTSHQPPPSGFLDVSVQYKQRPLRAGGSRGVSGVGRYVTLLVQIHRATGLKAAARAVAFQDSSLHYFTRAGVNAYVTLQLSFLSESGDGGICTQTRTVASTFCPEFNHQVEVPCNLLVQREGAVTRSLAELLQEAYAIFTLHNKEQRKGVRASRSKETVLGSVKIPLASLIHKRTGISGWFGLMPAQELDPSQASHSSVGGLEVSLSFAHHSDRDRLVKTARSIGWEWQHGDVDTKEVDEDEDDDFDDGGRAMGLCVSVAVPRAWLPLHLLLLPGDQELLRSTYCYFRYKLYEREACCSELRHPTLDHMTGCRQEHADEHQDPDDTTDGDEDGSDSVVAMTTVAFEGTSKETLSWGQPLCWYLREERLEVELWVAYGKGRGSRPCDTDRLVGSAFVDLSSLAQPSLQKKTISGVYPLFRRSTPDLSGAAVRVHISVESSPALNSVSTHHQGEQVSVEDEEELGTLVGMSSTPGRQTHARAHPAGHGYPRAAKVQEEDDQDTFRVNITVDRAMHLSPKVGPLAGPSAAGMSGYCVSYATVGPADTVTTEVVSDSTCPVWDHQQESLLSKQLLLDPRQSLVFKVWHKGEVERVIGFATVDLSPLLSGFHSVCGWYNISDFSGQCQGQLKVTVAPLKGLQELRNQRQTSAHHPAKEPSVSLSGLPLCYQTSGLYEAFPSHISRYSEQRITASPERVEHLFSQSRSSDRHEEHMDGVRIFHQHLHEGEGQVPQPSAAAGDGDPSRSVLFSALRRNLSELDDIQRFLSRKLSSSPGLVCGGHVEGLGGGLSGPMEFQDQPRDPETDGKQLLLKTSRLVGEVNNIISGLRECPGQLPSVSSLPPLPERASQLATQEQVVSLLDPPPPSYFDSSPSPTDCGSPGDTDPPVASYDPALASCHYSLTKQDQNRSVSLAPEGAELKNGGRAEEEEEEDDDEEEDVGRSSPEVEVEEQDNQYEEQEGPGEELELEEKEEEELGSNDEEEFEETLVEPRALNEVTSITDKTSPWTSQMSDPDFASLEDVEEEQPRSGSLMRMASNEEVEEEEEEEEEEENGSEIIVSSDSGGSDTEGPEESDANDTLVDPRAVSSSPPAWSNTQVERPGMAAIRESSSCLQTESLPSTSQENVELLEVPNFFLPPQHLEASMRALQLAPVFPKAATQPETSEATEVPHRIRPKPRFTPSAANKEETKRIAKIFASHFKDEH